MIRLDLPTRKLQVLLAAPVTTTAMSIITSYLDKTAVAARIVGGTALAATSGAGMDVFCPAPGTSDTRDIDTVSMQNRDSVPMTVNIIYDDNGNLSVIYKATLAVGDLLSYAHGIGWGVLAASGGVKVT